MSAEQLTFFSSLDFPGRTTLGLGEIAEKLGCTVQHLLNEIERGTFHGLNLAASTVARRAMRIPVECYRAYVLSKLTGTVDLRMQFIAELPSASRAEVVHAVFATLTAAERRSLLAALRKL
jgi:hypothetical protein